METFETLKQAFRDEAMSRTQTHEQYKRFKEGQTSRTMNVQDKLRHQKIKKTSKKFKSDSPQCHLTICEVAEAAKISKTTCHETVTENLGMHHVAAKFVPCLLNKFVLMSVKSMLTVKMLIKTL